MKRKKYMNKFKGIFSKQGKFALCPNERQVSLQAKHRFEAHHMIAAQFQAFQSYSFPSSNDTGGPSGQKLTF